MGNVTGIDVLKYLVEQHGHVQKDLSDVASRSNISEILSGSRNLNLKHIKALSHKYGVSPLVFIDE